MTPQQWAAISNAFMPFDPVRPQFVNQWFVSRPGDTLKHLLRLLSPERLPQRHILVGQLASGKSSELVKLAAELKEQHNALVVLFDLTDIVDVERTNPVEVLFLMGAALFKVAQMELPKNNQPDTALLEDLKEGLKTIVHTHTKNTTYDFDLSKLLSGLVVITGAMLEGLAGAVTATAATSAMQELFKAVAKKFSPGRFASGTNAEVVRKLEVEPQVETLIARLNKLIEDVESRIDHPIVLLVDGLDKIRDPNVISLNFLEKQFLNGPKCRVLYTGPLDLYYSTQFGETRNRFSIIPFSNIKLRERDGGGKNEEGYACMRRVVTQRLKSLNFTPEAVIDTTSLDLLIQGSGGVMRDLIRLVASAVLHAEIAEEPRITERAVYKALNELRIALVAQLDSRDRELLEKVRTTHERVVDDDDESKRFDQLLRNGVILSYINNSSDDIWCDVHSALTDKPWRRAEGG